ncbi:hypothetical protein [Haloarchaeobius iranensis]|uniref:DUF8060 domain-containing protein n=1 Tax=Haloarchaeobius iranensis TaxID=996166 RepID=A0A1G9Y5W8_9EURY|nr:hypothetical protein [Haloarchaeobius iranensis]SDN04046.1 hypothetical protein SAMN05192554_1133 [Haloarchaeobius iranensis]
MTDDDTTHDTDAPPADEPHEDTDAASADGPPEDTDAGFDFDGDDDGATAPGESADTAGTYTTSSGESRDEPTATRADITPPRNDTSAPRAPAAHRDSSRDAHRPNESGNEIRTYVLWAALAVLGLFSVVLLFQFYGSTMQAITDWVGPEYRSVVRSAVSLVLLCLTLVGVAQVTRELAD